MNKEEAKKQIDADEASINGVKLITACRAKDIIDAIDDHPKVKLPREVGEAWIEYVGSQPTGRGIDNLDMALMFLVREECPNDNMQYWYTVTPGAISILSDAYRYGWEAEPEAKWYVKTPESWESEDGDFGWLYKSIYGGVDTTSHGDGEEDEQFTRAEIKQYHLDNEIFTLVPVEADKEVSR